MKSNILLDLDGTLLDSKPGIVNCVNYALEKMGRPLQAGETLVKMIGPPLAQGFPQFLGTANPAVVAEAVVAYRERYDETGIYECELFEGVGRMLETLVANGRRLYLVTAKPRPYALRLLQHFSIDPLFQAVYAPTLEDKRDGKSHLIRELLDVEQIAADSAVMIGDRDRDIIGGRDNGVTSIGVLWGYGTANELSNCGADALVGSPNELLEQIS